MLQLDTVSAKLASPATQTDLRVTCAEVLGAVGHTNSEAAQAVLNQQGAHAFFHSCSECKARSEGQPIDLSKHLCIPALLYDESSEQQAANLFLRAPIFILKQVASCTSCFCTCHYALMLSVIAYCMTK